MEVGYKGRIVAPLEGDVLRFQPQRAGRRRGEGREEGRGGAPNGIRIRAAGLKGRCPRPLEPAERLYTQSRTDCRCAYRSVLRHLNRHHRSGPDVVERQPGLPTVTLFRQQAAPYDLDAARQSDPAP